MNANRNTTARGSDSFAYDHANRLTSATVAGQSSTYAYNGDRVRVSQTVAGFPTSYVQDVNRSLPVVLEDGGRKYVYGLGLAYAVQNVNGTERLQVYHPDGLGSVRAITDSAGAIVETYRADEFGVPLEEQGRLTQPFQYTGEPRDASGLVVLRARYYDPSLGRMMTRDPFAGQSGAISTLNRYIYVSNSPLRYTDRSGLCTDPDPMSDGIRYCIEAFIPAESVWGFRGDGRYPSATGGSYRFRLDVLANGDSVPSAGLSRLGPFAREADLGDCGAKSAVLDSGRAISASCSAIDGLALGLFFPAKFTLTVLETNGVARVTAAHGTPFPSIEVYQYAGANGAKLVYWYDSLPLSASGSLGGIDPSPLFLSVDVPLPVH